MEVERGKFCTTLWRESDLEVKIVKTPVARDVFGGQAQGFRRVAQYVAGAGGLEGFKKRGRVVDLKRVRNDAFRVAGARISGSVMSMFEASDAESLEGLQIISCYGNVTLQGSFRVAVTGLYASAQLFTKASYASWSSSCFSKEYARGWIRGFPDTIRLNPPPPPPPWRLVTLRSWVQPPLRPSSQKQWYLQCFLHYRAVKPR